ncbi:MULTISPECIES: hypothetical protein [Cyanophyceae]|uniref:hypothetical protein n=1 Tax=Cyanophyceae TaxID=3028117 RepID=UPI0015E7C12B|nr:MULTISPECIES: hypothetical protein [Cyanophyceae]MCP9797655.1 hypothetical protein [Cyanobium sp. Lug-B]MCP9932555.1 hypothetical protein [Cyanobium sp. Candia 9D4]
MGLAHCPLCMGLAALCVVRCGAHAVLLWRLWFGGVGTPADPEPVRLRQAAC